MDCIQDYIQVDKVLSGFWCAGKLRLQPTEVGDDTDRHSMRDTIPRRILTMQILYLTEYYSCPLVGTAVPTSGHIAITFTVNYCSLAQLAGQLFAEVGTVTRTDVVH